MDELDGVLNDVAETLVTGTPPGKPAQTYIPRYTLGTVTATGITGVTVRFASDPARPTITIATLPFLGAMPNVNDVVLVMQLPHQRIVLGPVLGAGGTVGGYFTVTTDSGANVILAANHGTLSDANLVLRTKGNGGIYMQNAAGTVTPLSVDTTATSQVSIDHLNVTGYVAGSPSGYNAELRLGSTAGGQGIGISSQSTGAPEMVFHHRGTSNTGTWTWKNGTNAAASVMSLDASGILNPVNMLKTGTAVSTANGRAGVIAISDIPAALGGNPVSGGYLYVNSGALTYRGPAGTVTVIANA